METLNSPLRLELAVAPSINNPIQFNELLSTYAGIRTIHSALSQLLVEQNEFPPDEYDPEGIIGLYLNSARSKLLIKAGADIQAGKFLETYVDAGVLKVRHTRCKTNQVGTSWHCLGLSLQDVKAGQVATVYVEPAIIVGFSGLTPGQKYFAYDEGQFTAGNTVTPVGGGATVLVKPCGVAITENSMRLASFWTSV